MKNNLVVKKLFVTVITLCLAMCLCLLYACNETPNNMTVKDDKNTSFTDCPLSAEGTFNDKTMTIEFTNNSQITVLGWEGAILYYNGSGTLKGSQGNTFFRIKSSDTIAKNKKSKWEYGVGITNALGSRLYLYYVESSDNTTWGNKDASDDQIMNIKTYYSINRDLSNYYEESCPLIDNDRDKSQIVPGYGLVINLKNNSEQSIIAYEAIIVQYNVYGEALKGPSDSSVYKTIKISGNVKPIKIVRFAVIIDF